MTSSELTHAVHDNGFHPVVEIALIAMQNDAGIWWPRGMPIESVAKVCDALDVAANNGTLRRALAHLERAAVAVSKKAGGKMVASHLALLCDAYAQEREARSHKEDAERRRRAQRLLGR
jgi:hypothetical protein